MDAAEFITSDAYDMGLSGVSEKKLHDLMLVARNLLPQTLIEDTIPTVSHVAEWPNDHVDYTVTFDATGPADAKLGNSGWHAYNGYLIEFSRTIPLATDDDGNTYTILELRVFDTERDEDPLDVLQDPPESTNEDAQEILSTIAVNPIKDATTYLLELRYHHE